MEESENQESTTTLLSDVGPSRKRIFLPIIVILVLVVGSLMAIKASVQKETKLAHQQIELVEGSEIPNLEMTRLDDTKVQLGDLSHKVVMINFWATWCEACVEEMPSMVQLRELYGSKGFEILGVNVDENPKKAAPPMISKLGMKFPIFTDKDNLLAEMFDIHAIPLTVIINKDRKILMVETGGREWNSDEVHQLMDKWLKD
jgi:alkyl hydroperoxide reductase subunit AhpC